LKPLASLSTIGIQVNWVTMEDADIQAAADFFYSVMLEMLDHFFPVKTVTITSRDPDFVVKSPTPKKLLYKMMRFCDEFI